MQIQSVSNKLPLQQNPQFKAAYPVYHWVANAEGKYSPVVTQDLTRSLHRKLVGFLNRSYRSDKPSMLSKMEQVVGYLSRNDEDFRKMPTVRSYYSHKPEDVRQEKEAISYLITGSDVKAFEDEYAKSIGRYKADAPFSAELNRALGDYKHRGMNFITNLSKKFQKKGQRQALHTKFVEVRNKKGKIIDYRLVDIRFCPAQGEENPLVKYYNLIKNQNKK